MKNFILPTLAFSFSDFIEEAKDYLSGKGLFELAGDIFNNTLGILYSLLGVNPSGETYAEAWNTVENLYNIFIIIGIPLITIFFIYGYCRDAVDIRAELQTETTVKMYIRLIMSVTLLNGLMMWIPKFFSWAIKLLGITEQSSMALDTKSLAEIMVEDSNIFTRYIFGLLFLLVVLVACALMIWTCLGRFLNLYILIPLAPIALSTLAAGGQAAQTGYAYIKSVLFYTFEVVVLGIVLAIAPAFISAFSFAETGSSGMTVMLEGIVKVITIAAGLKGSETLVKHSLNL